MSDEPRGLEVVRACRGRAEGPLSDQQLVENDAQRVDVGRRGHRIAANLLGRGIRRRQKQLEPGRFGSAGLGLEKLGDAEVEQLHFAGTRNEDVRRLQVAMHDERLVRVLGGLTHHLEQPQPLFDP